MKFKVLILLTFLCSQSIAGDGGLNVFSNSGGTPDAQPTTSGVGLSNPDNTGGVSEFNYGLQTFNAQSTTNDIRLSNPSKIRQPASAFFGIETPTISFQGQMAAAQSQPLDISATNPIISPQGQMAEAQQSQPFDIFATTPITVTPITVTHSSSNNPTKGQTLFSLLAGYTPKCEQGKVFDDSKGICVKKDCVIPDWMSKHILMLEKVAKHHSVKIKDKECNKEYVDKLIVAIAEAL